MAKVESTSPAKSSEEATVVVMKRQWDKLTPKAQAEAVVTVLNDKTPASKTEVTAQMNRLIGIYQKTGSVLSKAKPEAAETIRRLNTGDTVEIIPGIKASKVGEAYKVTYQEDDGTLSEAKVKKHEVKKKA